MGEHLHLIDHFLKQKSPIHDLDSRIKLVFTLSVILICAFLPAGSWPAYSLIFSMLVGLTYLAGIGFIYLLKRSALVLPFLLAALPLLFQAADSPLLSIQVGGLWMSISREGFIRFISLGIKSWLSVVAAVLLASTTSSPDLFRAMRSLRIPKLLVAIFSLMWRYLSLMIEEADRLMRARSSRSGINPAYRVRLRRNFIWRARVTGSMAGSLFIRSLERSERVYQAMLSRGYDGETRLFEDAPIGKKAIFFLVLAVTTLSFLILAVSLLAGLQ